jgi:hypothetical protein
VRDLTRRGGFGGNPRPPKGLAFAIEDLVLATEWARRNDVGMVVRLDHGSDDREEYEEVIALRSSLDAGCAMILWRSQDAVFVRPGTGRTERYRCVSEALESLSLCVVLTDIVATGWPVA